MSLGLHISSVDLGFSGGSLAFRSKTKRKKYAKEESRREWIFDNGKLIQKVLRRLEANFEKNYAKPRIKNIYADETAGWIICDR